MYIFYFPKSSKVARNIIFGYSLLIEGTCRNLKKFSKNKEYQKKVVTLHHQIKKQTNMKRKEFVDDLISKYDYLIGDCVELSVPCELSYHSYDEEYECPVNKDDFVVGIDIIDEDNFEFRLDNGGTVYASDVDADQLGSFMFTAENNGYIRKRQHDMKKPAGKVKIEILCDEDYVVESLNDLASFIDDSDFNYDKMGKLVGGHYRADICKMNVQYAPMTKI